MPSSTVVGLRGGVHFSFITNSFDARARGRTGRLPMPSWEARRGGRRVEPTCSVDRRFVRAVSEPRSVDDMDPGVRTDDRRGMEERRCGKLSNVSVGEAPNPRRDATQETTIGGAA